MIPVAPLEGTSRGSELVPPNQPPGFSRLPKMVSCQVGLTLIKIQCILGSHGQVPEELVVQEGLLLASPGVFEKANLRIELAKTVRSYQESSSFSASKVEVFLEVVRCLDTIAGHVRVDLMLGRFPSIIKTRFWLTVNSASTKERNCGGGQKAPVGACVKSISEALVQCELPG